MPDTILPERIGPARTEKETLEYATVATAIEYA